MNRKLIRPNLAEIKVKDGNSNNGYIQKEKIAGNDNLRRAPVNPAPRPTVAKSETETSSVKSKKTPPPSETMAEIYYYKKQIDSRTEMVIVLEDNEEIVGTIEWYDTNALKINRQEAPNLMVLKHKIKYMYKSDER